MMRRDQLFEELGEECSRERGANEKAGGGGGGGGSGSTSPVCLRKRKLARRTWGLRRNRVRGGREARAHRPHSSLQFF